MSTSNVIPLRLIPEAVAEADADRISMAMLFASERRHKKLAELLEAERARHERRWMAFEWSGDELAGEKP